LDKKTERPADLSEDSSFHYLKKPKLEVNKTPLSSADLNKTAPAFAPLVVIPPDEVRVKIEEVQSQISKTQTMLDRIRRLSKPSKRDIQNENVYVAKILDLKKKKEELKASIPADAPIPVQSKPNSQMFKLSFDWSPKKSGSVASGSTSGSGPDLKTSALGPWEPNIDGDDSTDEEEEVLPDLMHRLAGFMPVMGPIRDPFDDNGDFHGRGRDTWAGPQAKADE
jgi:hypothetical protein